MTTHFALDRQRAKIFGVCAGIANYFNVDASLIRLGFVVTTLLGFGFPVLIYLVTPLLVD